MKDGYYWVKINDEWYIQKYNAGERCFIDWYNHRIYNESVQKIGDYIETPEKYKE